MIFINFSVKFSKLTALSFFVSVFFYREAEFGLAYLAALMHEAAHAVVCIRFGIYPVGLDISIFGVNLKTPYIQSSRCKMLISAAGPAASFLLFGVFYLCGQMLSIPGGHYRFFVFANLFIGIINLLPISPLDGGTILKAIFAKHLGIIAGNKVYGIISAFFYAVFGVGCFYLSAGEIFNPSLILTFIFIAIGIRKEYFYSLLEKKTVLSGEIVSKKKIKYIACDAGSELLCLASKISSEYTILVAAFCDERFLGELCQDEVTEGIKKHGALCTVEEYIILYT